MMSKSVKIIVVLVVVLGLFSVSQALPLSPETGTVALWNFDSMPVTDISGNGNDLTAFGTVGITSGGLGVYGEASMENSGTGDRWEAADSASLDIIGAITIEMSLKTRASVTGRHLINKW